MQNMEQIYEECFETVYKYLFCLTHNADISDELTQETFYKAVKKLARIMNNAKFLSGYVKLLKTLDLTNVEKIKKL